MLIPKRALIIGILVCIVSGLSGLFAFQTKLIYFPDDRQLSDCDIPTGTQLINIEAERALFTAQNHAHLVVFFHGNAGSACNWRYLGINHLAPLGYDTLVVEYPGFAGDPRGPSKKTIEDAIPAFHSWVDAQSYDTVTLMGYSLGSGVGSLYAEAYGADQIILFAPFDTIYSVITEMGYSIPRAILTEDYDNIAALSHIDAPIYIRHGAADDVIPPIHSEKLQSALVAAGRSVTRELIPNQGHAGLFESPAFDQLLETILIHAKDN